MVYNIAWHGLQMPNQKVFCTEEVNFAFFLDITGQIASYMMPFDAICPAVMMQCPALYTSNERAYKLWGNHYVSKAEGG